MKRAAPSQTARELDSLTASFVKVRILHHASAAPATATSVAKQLGQPDGRSTPAQILSGLARQGLLRPKANPPGHAQKHSLTPKGRRLLALARTHLRQLATQKIIH